MPTQAGDSPVPWDGGRCATDAQSNSEDRSKEIKHHSRHGATGRFPWRIAHRLLPQLPALLTPAGAQIRLGAPKPEGPKKEGQTCAEPSQASENHLGAAPKSLFRKRANANPWAAHLHRSCPAWGSVHPTWGKLFTAEGTDPVQIERDQGAGIGRQRSQQVTNAANTPGDESKPVGFIWIWLYQSTGSPNKQTTS